MPFVVIELAVPDPPAALATAMVDACTAAIREGRCALGTDADTTPSSAVAIVRWDEDDERGARVQVGTDRAGRTDWRTRVLVFQRSDARIEKWRAVGLTIATLSTEVRVEAEAAASSATGGSPEPDPPRSARSAADARSEQRRDRRPAESKTGEPDQSGETASHADDVPSVDTSATDTERVRAEPGARQGLLWLGLSGLAASSLPGGLSRFGAGLDAGWLPFTAPVELRVGLEHTARPVDEQRLSLQWDGAWVGVGARLELLSWLAVEPRITLVLESMRASTTERRTGRDDSRAHWGGVACGAADVVIGGPGLGVVAGFDVTRRSASTDIYIEDRLAASLPATAWGGRIGVRVFLR